MGLLAGEVGRCIFERASFQKYSFVFFGPLYPARGNLAELGLGVLADFGITPIGEVLLDEKLGLHLAFGRSEHFGGQVGPESFSKPEAVMHQDHVYLSVLQPRVSAARVVLTATDGESFDLIRDGDYAISF